MRTFEKSTYKDPRDGKVYKTTKITGSNITWMAENLNFDFRNSVTSYNDDQRFKYYTWDRRRRSEVYGIEESWIYRGEKDFDKRYGRLYTWYAAQDACPPGWRLPSIKEWDWLIRSFSPTIAYKNLSMGGVSGFDVQLGGKFGIYANFSNLNKVGSYWMITDVDLKSAFNYSFIESDQKISLGYTWKTAGLSCRCVLEE